MPTRHSVMPSANTPWVAAWARSAVVARGGAFKTLAAHDIATPVLHSLLQRAGIAAHDVDTVVLGNALAAGGNPARMLALHAGLPQHCSALTIDTQCCAGLDAVAMGAALIAAGQAHVVVAGGAEAWSRSPIRMHRPLDANTPPTAYERPAFAPTPEQDPDLLLSAARYAATHAMSRATQEAYAVQSHTRAEAHRAQVAHEIAVVAGVTHDALPRTMTLARAARMPVVARTDALAEDAADAFALSALTISLQADGAALVLLVSTQAAERLRLEPSVAWLASASIGGAPESPLVCAEAAARQALTRAHVGDIHAVDHIELHDAFAVQGLSFAQGLGLSADQLNLRGGGLARGHPIGASGAIALVRVLTDVSMNPSPHALGLVAVAGAGGLGSAAVLAKR